MDNTYYVLSNHDVKIERFHICTWESLKGAANIEFGVEIDKNTFANQDIHLYIAIPFVKKPNSQEKTKTRDLYDQLTDKKNLRFIFNDVVKNPHTIGDDERNGCIVEFEKREKLVVLPCKVSEENGYLDILLKKPTHINEEAHDTGNYYFRIIVETEKPIAEQLSGISQKSYLYDIKINISRNIPDEVYDLKKDKELKICKIKKMFCFHNIPDSFELSFVNYKDLQNIRKLETSAFLHYLPELNQVKKGHTNTVFLKSEDTDEKGDGYSFFTVCTDESIGIRQVALAVGANILISLLFAISAFRISYSPLDQKVPCYEQIPFEYYAALSILVILCIVVFCWNKLTDIWREIIKRRGEH